MNNYGDMLPIEELFTINKLGVTVKTLNANTYFKAKEYSGAYDTMDLEIDSEFHNFYANDICVSNSHSVSYSYIGMQTLYLKHYYPTEFYCALLNHPKTYQDKDKERQWIGSAIMSAMSKGMNIVPPNRKSNWEWTIIDDKTIAMGYSSINGLGEIAFKELKDKKVQDLDINAFFNTKWSKFNKKSFEVCVKAGLFDDWSSSREEIISWRSIKIHDVKQYAMFTNEVGFAAVAHVKKYPLTTEEQKYTEFIEVCNLDLRLLKKIEELKKLFFKETNMEIEPVTNFEDPTKYYYFCLNDVKEQLSGRGTKYYSLMIGDGIISKKVNMWANMYDKVKGNLTKDSFYVTKFLKQKGFLAFNASAQFRKVL